MLGIVLGLTLVSGQLLNAYSVASTATEDIPKWDFGFFKVDMIGYQAQVLPAILAAFALVYLEKFFPKGYTGGDLDDRCSVLQFDPCCCCGSFCDRTIGWKIGSAISSVVYAGITGSFKIVFGAIFWIYLCTACYYWTTSYE